MELGVYQHYTGGPISGPAIRSLASLHGLSGVQACFAKGRTYRLLCQIVRDPESAENTLSSESRA